MENILKSYYTISEVESLSKVFTPLEVREKMTKHAEEGDSILVLFNFEFCSDLYEKGLRDVKFASDDKLRNELVRKLWGFETFLVDSKNIGRDLKGMKFDLIISNPPYNKGLDLKILESVLDLGEKICFVHPAGWLLDNKLSNPVYNRLREITKTRLSEVEIINPNIVFQIRTTVPCSINFFIKHSTFIKVNDTSRVLTREKLEYEVENIYDIDKWGNDKIYLSIKKKILSFPDKLLDNLSDEKPFRVGLNGFGIGQISNPTMECFYSMIKRTKEIEFHINKKQPLTFSFSTENEQKNFLNYLKTKFARFCLSITKNNQHIDSGELISVPWLDFSVQWDDEKASSYVGLTTLEIEWIKSKMPDFYV